MNDDVYSFIYILLDLQLKTRFFKKLTETAHRIKFYNGRTFSCTCRQLNISVTQQLFTQYIMSQNGHTHIKNHTTNDVKILEWI